MRHEDKRREARLRRVADRHGLSLRKSRRRDGSALDYGRYALIDSNSGFTIFKSDPCGSPYVADLDDIEEYFEPSEKELREANLVDSSGGKHKYRRKSC